MKKSTISLNADCRKPYEQPAMDVVELAYAPHLLYVSGDKMDIVDDDEEEDEWPVDPDTNKPYSPW